MDVLKRLENTIQVGYKKNVFQVLGKEIDIDEIKKRRRIYHLFIEVEKHFNNEVNKRKSLVVN